MNVSELFALTRWIDEKIVVTKIVKLYQQLHAVLLQNTQPNQAKQPFESQRNNLIDAIKKVPLEQLTDAQQGFLRMLGISDFVGDRGIEFIEDNLYKNGLDLATAAKRIEQCAKSIDAGIAKSNQIKAGLQNCVGLEEYELQDEVLMRVKFSGKAPISNVVDLREWADAWFDIGRGIAMANGGAPEDVRVIGASKGSIIVELAVAYAIAKTASAIILMSLNVAERVWNLRIQAENLRGLKLKNDKLAAELEKEADEEKDDGAKKITEAISAELGIKIDGQGDKLKALEKSVTKLINFIERGGKVDFIAPAVNGADEKAGEKTAQIVGLREQFEKVRIAEAKIAMLENKLTDNELIS